MSGSVAEDARAKINLTLRVLGRRADGYHELRSLVVFAGTGDRLTARPAAALSLDIEGPFAPALGGEADNLVLRAAHVLRERAGVTAGAHLTLEKNLPVASGIGGGSADAAAALRALMRLWNVAPDEVTLMEIAAALGADVPVCLASRAAMMGGTGEKIAPLASLPVFHIVLVNPAVALSTAAVFGALAAPPLGATLGEPAAPSFATLDDLVNWLASEPNDLEAPALSLAPVLHDVRAALSASAGCRLARMSGSGATCFGIYASEMEATDAARAIAAAHPGWWVVTSKVSGSG